MARHDNVKLQLKRYSSSGWSNANNIIDGSLDTVAYVDSPSSLGSEAYFMHSVKNLLPNNATIHDMTITCVGTSAAKKTHFGVQVYMFLSGEPSEQIVSGIGKYGTQTSPVTISKTYTPEAIEEAAKTAGNVQYRQYYQTGDRTKMPTLLDLINGNVSKYYTDNSAGDTHGFIIGINVYAQKTAFSTAGKVTVSEAYLTISYTLPDYTLTVTAGTGGTVTGGGTYESGTTATLTATPSDGYKFVQWSDGDTNATRTVTVTADKTYTAEFAKTGVNKIYVGTQNPTVYVGTTKVKAVYVGTTKIYG